MDMAIGGYFELELSKKSNLFPDYLALNSARNCLEYILRLSIYNNIFIPYYTCDVLLEPLQKLNITYEFYDVDFNLEPIFDFSLLKKEDAFLYTNYFGLKNTFVKNLSAKIPGNIIIDNAQALFAEPVKNIPTFYSPRKFVGVPDGGFVTCNLDPSITFGKDSSYERMSHLLKRIDTSAESGYGDFKRNDKSLENQPIKLMSDLTKLLLMNIDFHFVKEQRQRNFQFLHDKLKKKNLLSISYNHDSIPMVYPFRTKDPLVKEKLINQKIYCASYWPNVIDWCSAEQNSHILAKEIVALPIDQRYSVEDMEKILQYV
ncbi:hypothetical protein [Chryseobacterium sp. Leaf394]|uniref:hypothetical protein n=1 Tax=Chryseobacterium sp. Leaf394 TaxID=1736361 RepID=UPI0007016653|nr:hypothetical protein [Chryseobacterium sp. Leaf394]KQS95214.1 hypothetical protein ASG21_17390 [Chryseobacterium sp. Leaf394]